MPTEAEIRKWHDEKFGKEEEMGENIVPGKPGQTCERCGADVTVRITLRGLCWACYTNEREAAKAQKRDMEAMIRHLDEAERVFKTLPDKSRERTIGEAQLAALAGIKGAIRDEIERIRKEYEIPKIGE